MVVVMAKAMASMKLEEYDILKEMGGYNGEQEQ